MYAPDEPNPPPGLDPPDIVPPNVTVEFGPQGVLAGPGMALSIHGTYVGPDTGSSFSIDLTRGALLLKLGGLEVSDDDLFRRVLETPAGSDRRWPFAGSASIAGRAVSADGTTEVSARLREPWHSFLTGQRTLEVSATTTIDLGSGGELRVELRGEFSMDRIPPWISVPVTVVVVRAVKAYMEACGGAPCPVPI